ARSRSHPLGVTGGGPAHERERPLYLQQADDPSRIINRLFGAKSGNPVSSDVQLFFCSRCGCLATETACPARNKVQPEVRRIEGGKVSRPQPSLLGIGCISIRGEGSAPPLLRLQRD